MASIYEALAQVLPAGLITQGARTYVDRLARDAINDTVRDVKTTTSAVFTETVLERTRLTDPVTDESVTLLSEIGYHIEGGVVTIDYVNQSADCDGGG